MNQKLYNAISEFAAKFGRLKWNDDENMKAFRELVDLSIKAGKIPEANRMEPSTWGCLEAAVTYLDNRIRYCQDDIN